MAKNETISVTYLDLMTGEKLLLQRARLILPYLVRQAKAGRPIYYSDLTDETGIPNPRNLNYPLGAIGNGLISLGKKLDLEIPPIQCLVINKVTNLPGEGIGWFISESEFKKLGKSRKTELIKFHLTKIFTFPHWNRVLDALNLNEINIDISSLIEKAKAGGYGGGESQSHKTFKEALAKRPKLLGLNTGQGQLEYRLPSADCIDVLFTFKGQLIAVEAKSIISADDDILRGLFQCIKYKHLIEAEQIIKNLEPNSRVILAMEGKFPAKLLAIKNMLGIEVFEKIHI
ncbi:hypothetical protein NLG42_19600 [Flavobacterium plurextorum]|uniref:hypothetical protein n=1 Tax=Flavobacterium TaxID=237 RepID=UPI00214D6C13|nr:MULTISPECIES: hypothetical protein [Flavobacterium]UUW08300.1 hypothetical protein NLG42_19600 [Flavobacterium plurextorum]